MLFRSVASRERRQLVACYLAADQAPLAEPILNELLLRRADDSETLNAFVDYCAASGQPARGAEFIVAALGRAEQPLPVKEAMRLAARLPELGRRDLAIAAAEALLPRADIYRGEVGARLGYTAVGRFFARGTEGA